MTYRKVGAKIKNNFEKTNNWLVTFHKNARKTYFEPSKKGILQFFEHRNGIFRTKKLFMSQNSRIFAPVKIETRCDA